MPLLMEREPFNTNSILLSLLKMGKQKLPIQESQKLFMGTITDISIGTVLTGSI